MCNKIVHRLFLAVAITLHNFTSFYTYFYILLCINIIWVFTLQHFNNFSHTRLFIYVRLLLFNLLFLESIHSLLFRHIIIFLNHGQYTLGVRTIKWLKVKKVKIHKFWVHHRLTGYSEQVRQRRGGRQNSERMTTPFPHGR